MLSKQSKRETDFFLKQTGIFFFPGRSGGVSRGQLDTVCSEVVDSSTACALDQGRVDGQVSVAGGTGGTDSSFSQDSLSSLEAESVGLAALLGSKDGGVSQAVSGGGLCGGIS
jgi:hypothetical protein